MTCQWNRAIILLLYSTLSINAGTWQVLVYMDSSDQLSDMALKNITDMVFAQPNDHVQFLVQLHAFDQIAHRYSITKTGLVCVQETVLQGTSKQDIIDAAQWAFDTHNADHTMLIIWNHGWGILDPVWNREKEEWLVENYSLKNPLVPMHTKHKGYLFNNTSHSYLSHQDLTYALQTIVNTTLNGIPIDVIAFDTCMGAMIEIAYQIAPYASYLVGSQSCSLRDGFNYRGIVTSLNKGLEPKQTSSDMVEAFDSYYACHDPSGIYTHAAIELHHIPQLHKLLDQVSKILLAHPQLLPHILDAHTQSQRFCLFPMYTDIVSFLHLIESKVDTGLADFQGLQTALRAFYSILDNCIVHRCAGHATRKATHGLSIYLPQKHIDQTYPSTIFAHSSAWLTLLKTLEPLLIN